jgi:hypothetical protein
MLRVIEENSSLEVKEAWERFSDVWRPIYQTLEQNLEDAVTLYKKFEHSWERDLDSVTPLRSESGVPLPTPQICAISFIKAYGLSVRRFFFSHEATST